MNTVYPGLTLAGNGITLPSWACILGKMRLRQQDTFIILLEFQIIALMSHNYASRAKVSFFEIITFIVRPSISKEASSLG